MASAPASMLRIRGGVQMQRTQYLAGFKGSNYPTVPSTAEKSEATFDGTLSELGSMYEDRRLQTALYNDIKACPRCSKPCAFTLAACNACGTGLEDVAVSQSENVFSAFLFGVKRAQKGFPYTISVRREAPDVLVFDDMLALTPCHFNGISTKYYIPDWRFLLTAPESALGLLDTIEDELWKATLPFLDNKEFRKVIFKGEPTGSLIRSKVIKSFNFPPSQFQMHVQWLVPPLVPFQHFMAEMRQHFHEDRAFPLSYVRKVLELGVPYDVKKDTPIQDIVDFYDARGVVYKTHWKQFYEKAIKDSMDLANWDPEDFEYVVEEGKAYRFSICDGEVKKEALVEGVDPSEVQKRDCAALQNYGRPYTAEGKPSGTYIKNPRQPVIGIGGYEEWPGVFPKEDAVTSMCGLFCGRREACIF